MSVDERKTQPGDQESGVNHCLACEEVGDEDEKKDLLKSSLLTFVLSFFS